MRLVYWRQTSEIPFSDMADYLDIARRVACCFDFSHSAFWLSYKPPVLPLFGALAHLITPEDPLATWRVIQLLFLLCSLLWLAIENNRATGREVFGIGLLFVVALSKSSVFWSYKFATEGLSEAFIYLLLAATLATLRAKRWLPLLFFLLGIVYAGSFLLRPNMVILVPAFIVLFYIFRDTEESDAVPLRLIGLFLVGLATAWAPWLYRSYTLYGHVVPLSTQGVYSFLWELGGIEVTEPNGKVVMKDVSDLQREAPARFKNDFEASEYAGLYAKKWLREHWHDDYPELVAIRLRKTFLERQVALSKVSRTKLSEGLMEELLIDKAPLFLMLGILGLGMFFLLAPEQLFMIPAAAVLPPLFSSLFVGDPRFLEPTLPLILYGNVALLVGFWVIIARYGRRRRPAARQPQPL